MIVYEDDFKYFKKYHDKIESWSKKDFLNFIGIKKIKITKNQMPFNFIMSEIKETYDKIAMQTYWNVLARTFFQIKNMFQSK